MIPSNNAIVVRPLYETFPKVAKKSPGLLTKMGKDGLFHLMMSLEKTEFYKLSETCRHLFVLSRQFSIYKPFGEGRACAFLSNYEIRTAVMNLAKVHFKFIEENLFFVTEEERTNEFIVCEYNLSNLISRYAESDSGNYFYQQYCSKIYGDLIAENPYIFSKKICGNGTEARVFKEAFSKTEILINDNIKHKSILFASEKLSCFAKSIDRYFFCDLNDDVFISEFTSPIIQFHLTVNAIKGLLRNPDDQKVQKDIRNMIFTVLSGEKLKWMSHQFSNCYFLQSRLVDAERAKATHLRDREKIDSDILALNHSCPNGDNDKQLFPLLLAKERSAAKIQNISYFMNYMTSEACKFFAELSLPVTEENSGERYEAMESILRNDPFYS